MLSRITGVAAGLLLAIAVSACSSGRANPGQGEPELPATLPLVNMATFALPLDAYRMTAEQSLTAYNARNVLLVRCLLRFGFTVVPPAALGSDAGGVNERRYFLVDEGRARAYGYKWPEITNQQRPPEPALAPEAQAVMSGRGPSLIGGVAVPDGGCAGEAQRELGFDNGAEAGAALVRRLDRESNTRMQQDGRVLAAVKRWSGCMTRAGYHYADPAKANDDPAFATAVATPSEIATATADVACKKETNLVNIMAAVETAYQRRAVDENQPRLREFEESVAKQIRIAADVVAARR